MKCQLDCKEYVFFPWRSHVQNPIMVGGQDPRGSRPARLSLMELPLISLVQSSGICLPLDGVSTSIWWAFSPMEVRANHLPMSTCPLGMALQQQQVRHP
jgi:hypothetical protein